MAYISDMSCLSKQIENFFASLLVSVRSLNYFSSLFKKTFKINFINFITQLRIEKARELYLNTDMKIYEIAEQVGYSDWRYFYRVY